MLYQERNHTKYYGFQRSGIQEVNLENVKRKLMLDFPEGCGWTQKQADEAEKWYKRYLYLILLNPEFPYVPNKPIDSFWHQHILDTRQYSKDCDYLFNRFLHHYPYFGMNGDAKDRDDAFKATNQEYIKHFGEDCTSMNFHDEGKEKKFGDSMCTKVAVHCKKGCGAGCQQR